jgi:hypothetical protein
MSDLSNGGMHSPVHTLCARCGVNMNEVVSIPPRAYEHGLRAYDCPKCHYVTSVLVQPERRRAPPSRVMKSAPSNAEFHLIPPAGRVAEG